MIANRPTGQRSLGRAIRALRQARVATAALSVACLLILGAQAGLASDAKTYFVSTTGSDSNSGTETRPFRTLKKGVSVLTPGAVLYVMSGTYREALIHTIPSGTSWDRPVTVAAYPGHTVTLKPDPGVVAVLRFVGPQAFIIVDGFIIDGQNATYDAIKITGSARSGMAHHIRIVRCEVKNAPRQGLLVTSDSNELIALKVHNNGASQWDHGFYISGSHNLIEASEVYRNAGAGIHVYRSKGGAHYNVARNNMVYANAASGIILASGTGHQAYNNLVWENTTGLRIDYGAVDVEVYNNTTYSNKVGIHIGASSTRADVRNNINYRNGTALVDKGSQTSESHNMSDDPGFIDPSRLDFRLSPDSSAIDSGALLTSVDHDHSYTQRPQGVSHDIGAFEFKR
jgi:Right handed beta helix region/Protein of unknown function (DUF1565)